MTGFRIALGALSSYYLDISNVLSREPSPSEITKYC